MFVFILASALQLINHPFSPERVDTFSLPAECPVRGKYIFQLNLKINLKYHTHP